VPVVREFLPHDVIDDQLRRRLGSSAAAEPHAFAERSIDA
jgi:hypothetical protein